MKKIFDEGASMVLEQGTSNSFKEAGKNEIFFAAIRNQIDEFAPLPPSTLFFGIAKDDSRPVLLNLMEPRMGSIVICGNMFSGKTSLLQAIAAGAAYLYTPEELQFVIVTPNYLEWAGWVNQPGCGGVYSSEKRSFEKIVDAMDLWMRRSSCSQKLLFFIDSLSVIQCLNSAAASKLQKLLAIGSYRNIWPVVTATEDELYYMTEWNRCFRKKILSISKKGTSVFGQEFAVKVDDSWCEFSILR